MDDQRQMMEAQSELEHELEVIFNELEEGVILGASQIDTLRYACGFPKKKREIPVLPELFNEFTAIFGGKK